MELVIKSHCARQERSCYKFKTVSSHLIPNDSWQFGVWFIDPLAVCYISNGLLICTVDMIDSFCWATFRTILTLLKLSLVWESDVHQNRTVQYCIESHKPPSWIWGDPELHVDHIAAGETDRLRSLEDDDLCLPESACTSGAGYEDQSPTYGNPRGTKSTCHALPSPFMSNIGVFLALADPFLLCECNSFVCWWRKLYFCLKFFLPTQCHGLLMFFIIHLSSYVGQKWWTYLKEQLWQLLK